MSLTSATFLSICKYCEGPLIKIFLVKPAVIFNEKSGSPQILIKILNSGTNYR